MTRRRFATEWLWFISCVMLAWFGTFVYMSDGFDANDLRESLLLVAVVGAVWSVPLYLAIGAVRLTLWALVNAVPDEDHPLK